MLKVIALTAMLLDHVGAVFPDHVPFAFRLIGRLTFPIFVYLIAEGFRYTRSPEKFLLRLLAFAVISEPFYDWTIVRSANIEQGLSPWHVDFLNRTNIFFTLFLGGVAIVVLKHVYDAFIQRLDTDSPIKAHIMAYVNITMITFPVTYGLMSVADFIGSDYGGYGVLFILLMYVIKNKLLRISVFAVMNVLQHRGLISMMMDGITLPLEFQAFIPFTLITVPLIALYNGKRGPSLKWLFYIAYPAHLAILAVIAWQI